jgi:hypothetical protein
MGGACSKYTVFWLENRKDGNHLEDLGLDGKIILEWILEKYSGKLWTGFI